MTQSKKALLIILDGWGYREEKEANAIFEAPTPFFDHLWHDYPHCLLDASGIGVGLPEGEIGNSEIGHMTMGAGRMIGTDVVRINDAIKSGEIEQNQSLNTLFEHVHKNNSTLHIQGLVSPSGVHGHHQHLYAILRLAKKRGLEKIAIHAFTDGRDVPPKSAAQYLQELEAVLEEIGIGFIASASGRFYAMDRDNNWDRVQKVEAAIFSGQGKQVKARKPSEVIKELYNEGIVDEHLEPVVFLDKDDQTYTIKENDGILFLNFRADRARMLSKKIADYAEDKNVVFVTMTEYDPKIKSLVVFPPIKINTTLATVLANQGLSQAHIAETEKYAHVTYFFNGGIEDILEYEERIMINSRKDIKTHDLAPEMMAEEIGLKVVEQIKKGTNFIVVNFANADIVGHTANREAILAALTTLDQQLAKIVPAGLDQSYNIIITADHGNAEQYIDPKSLEKHTAHTTNPVPFIVTKKGLKLEDGTLANIAPTILELLDIEQPVEMTAKSLIVA